MSFKILPKEALPDWVAKMLKEFRVIAPTAWQGSTVFREIHSPDEIDWDYAMTILPPKKALLPQYEPTLEFHLDEDGPDVKPITDAKATVVLGVHTCDMHALQLVDRAFRRNYPDQHYLSHRENATFVSLECLRPCTEHSFCKDMGTLSIPEEFDLHLTDLGDDYAIEIGSERGQALVKGLRGLRDATLADLERSNKVISEKWPHFSYRLKFDVSELASLLSISYDDPIWEELGERCLACGSCTAVCPTCYCFDVIDEVEFNLQAGKRIRIWDSCQLDQFATVAGGHNFRATRAARQRHRFYHKGKYQTEEFGIFGCVGCGRCAQSCLVHITPVDTFNELYSRQVHKAEKAEEVAV
jgi:sulfhydrogenase subunit beta (sulfur reductase)